MRKPLRVLIVEDNDHDAELTLRELRRGGFDVTHERVVTHDAMAAALTRQPWDVVVADYSMPRFSAPRALALLKERQLDLPFLIVSGTVGEDVAVVAMRAGAHDFISKGKLARLVPAVERELREAAVRAERATMREQLLVSDRMASVGTLAAGVAHEINNPLAALMANLQFATEDVLRLVRDLDADAAAVLVTRLREIEEPLRDAHECADHVRTIVKDLKLFSRGDEEKRGAVDVRPVLESALRMAWNEIRHRARLVKDYGPAPPVEGNEGRLGQLFLNLVVNAAQAIPEGNAASNEIRIVTRQDERGRVVVEVRDTGAGIPEAARARIFEPFFTTKPAGVGTGMGLAICHRIVAELGGEIVVESELGRGTTFRLVLPAATGGPRAAAGHAPPVVHAQRRGHLLLVDDEPLLLAALRRILSAEHDVVGLTSGRDAIERVAGGERFDVILCDLMMPEMTGMDVHAELARLAPDQARRMVFITGGAFTGRAHDFLQEVGNPRVEKPFDGASLTALVNGLLRSG
jgi:signal transduction histidine kinase